VPPCRVASVEQPLQQFCVGESVRLQRHVVTCRRVRFQRTHALPPKFHRIPTNSSILYAHSVAESERLFRTKKNQRRGNDFSLVAQVSPFLSFPFPPLPFLSFCLPPFTFPSPIHPRPLKVAPYSSIPSLLPFFSSPPLSSPISSPIPLVVAPEI